jgi:hypothetical protein
MNSLGLKQFYYKLILLLIPLFIGLQSFLPKPVETVFIIIKLLIGPLIILFYIKNKIDILWLLFVLCYIIILSLLFPPNKFDDFKLTFLSIFTSLAFYLLGKKLVYRSDDNSKYKFLAYGVNLFNSISIVLYLFIYFEIISLFDIYKIIYREDETDLFRFSLGNAIEMPFTMTCLLFASIVLTGGSKNYIFATLLNLLLAFISQSRIVVIISLLLFIYEFCKINLKYKIMTGILIYIVFLLAFIQVSELLNSTIDRYSGNDAGSIEERSELYNLFEKGFGIGDFIIGGGLTSSSELRYRLTRVYGSIESVFLQMIFEIGFFVTIFIFYPIVKSNLKTILLGRYRVALILVYIQLLFFLPVYTSMITTFFLFGVCSKFVH